MKVDFSKIIIFSKKFQIFNVDLENFEILGEFLGNFGRFLKKSRKLTFTPHFPVIFGPLFWKMSNIDILTGPGQKVENVEENPPPSAVEISQL